jgi:hypothetical protein
VGEDNCKLLETRGFVRHCEGPDCVFWRVIDHVGHSEPAEGCAIEHFELLGDVALVDWLVSVKDRVEQAGGAVG